MIRAGHRVGAHPQRIASRGFGESPTCLRKVVSCQPLHRELTAATATHSRLELLAAHTSDCIWPMCWSMVCAAGLEPARLSAADFESASIYFITRAVNAVLYCASIGLRFWRRRLGRQPWPHAAISPIAARRSVAPTWPAVGAYYSSWFRPLLRKLG